MRGTVQANWQIKHTESESFSQMKLSETASGCVLILSTTFYVPFGSVYLHDYHALVMLN